MVKRDRKLEILHAAKKVFLQNGFENTTMEAIIKETSLSKGGFYYYYSSTTIDILHDLMKMGMFYRTERIKDFLADNCIDDLDEEALSNILVDKMLDSSEFMSIYVMYLLACRKNQKLKELFPRLVKETLNISYYKIKGTNGILKVFSTDFMICFMNAIMVGCEELGAREVFKENREILIDFVKIYLKFYYKKVERGGDFCEEEKID